MKREQTVKTILRTVSSFFSFFLLAAFVTTCCIMLFISALQGSIGRRFTEEEISIAAKITMVNVVLISIGMAVVDYLRRRVMVDKPVRMITAATERIMNGDFSARVEPLRGSGMEGFDRVGEAINTMAAELSGVETLRTDFVANVSHEMKTPLAVMQNYGTLLQTPDLPEEKRLEYAKAITEASRRLSDMMTNVLKLNRLENQTIYPRTETYDLGEQLCESLLRFESVWEKKDITIETDIAEEVLITADAELLSLVWNNLLSNAFKFTEAGGTVSLSMTTDGDCATVRVADTGCGMTPEVGAHIFEKFYQGDTSRATQGNGLGLALVKRVVDILRAEIGVESAVGVGTVFTVKIKIGEADHGPEEAL